MWQTGSAIKRGQQHKRQGEGHIKHNSYPINHKTMLENRLKPIKALFKKLESQLNKMGYPSRLEIDCSRKESSRIFVEQNNIYHEAVPYNNSEFNIWVTTICFEVNFLKDSVPRVKTAYHLYCVLDGRNNLVMFNEPDLIIMSIDKQFVKMSELKKKLYTWIEESQLCT